MVRSARSRVPALLASALLAVAGAAGLWSQTTTAQGAVSPVIQQPATLANFDIRTEKTPAAASYVEQQRASSFGSARLADVQADGLARLRARSDGMDVALNPGLGVPEVVGLVPGTGFLTGPSSDRVGTLRAFLGEQADAFGLSASEVDTLDLAANYENPSGNMAWVEFEQKINGLPVFQGTMRGGFTAKGELVRTTGLLAPGLSQAALSTVPAFDGAGAIARAVKSVGWNAETSALAAIGVDATGKQTFTRGTMDRSPRAWQVYFPLGPGVARLAWVTEIWSATDVFMIVLDADDGTVLFRKNLTNYQTQTASFNVYDNDSPAPMSPVTMLPGSGTQAAPISRSTIVLRGNEAPNTFNNNGWITDGVSTTTGNAVVAGIDRDGTNGIDAVVTGPGRVFNFTYDPTVTDPLTAAYQQGEVTNGFYWANRYHDRLYRSGFTEAARNFQTDNFSRGGVSNDAVQAEIQDSSGTNNANFATPADGGFGRMQMYLFTGPTPDRGGALDADIVLHELTHGLSNRLIGNAAGLTTTMSGAMGEGWSDFYARAVLSTADESTSGIYSTGGWATYLLSPSFTDNYYYGIRRFPYAVKTAIGSNSKPHNPLTFADIDPAQMNLTDGAYVPNPLFAAGSAFEVHNAGEVWASALFEVRARLINRLGFAVGNDRVLQIVTDGMKLSPLNPTFIQGRDAILAAAAALPSDATATVADVWAGFAARGMGFSASVVNAASGTVIEAFDTPGVSKLKSMLVSESIPNGRLDPTEVVGVSFCLTNNGGATSGSVTGSLQATGGVLSPSGSQSFGTIAPAAVTCRTFTFTVDALCGNSVTATLQVTEPSQPTKDFTFPMTVGSPVIIATQNFDGVAAPALPSGWTTSTLVGTANLFVTTTTLPSGVTAQDTTPNAVFAGDPASVSDNVLVSPNFAIPAAATQLSFKQVYAFEAGASVGYDGGVLEISIAGGAWADIMAAGGSFSIGGYNRTISSCCGSPIAGRQAWSSASSGRITTVVNLPPSAQGQLASFRWRMASDSSVASTGWWIDSVRFQQAAYQCGPGATEYQELIQNGHFEGNDTTRWSLFSTPSASDMQSFLSGNVFNFFRVKPPAGTSNQATIFQNTGVPLPAFAAIQAEFRVGNTSSVRKRISVLTLDSDFSDLAVCTFWLPPNSPLQSYRVRSHTTKAWNNASIYFYAASVNEVSDSGYYQLADVSLQYRPDLATDRTDCIDPEVAAPVPGGPNSGNLLTNGDFATGLLTPWSAFGTITQQISGGVLQFIKPSNTAPAGVVLQATGQGMSADQIMTSTFQLGNSSGVRKRVTVLLHDNSFGDLAACTFWLAPGQPLTNYSVKTYATQAWTNATLSIYPATVGADQWILFDNATMQRTPAASLLGTECIEPLASFSRAATSTTNGQ